MDQIAYMKKSWGMVEKIIKGEKNIESRWYKTKHVPWGNINPGDRLFFKYSGEAIKTVAYVQKVLKYENLNTEKVKEILGLFGDSLGIEKEKLGEFYNLVKNKKYCLLIFIIKVKEIKPIEISKKGYGVMAAWISVDSIDRIRR